MWSTDGWEKQTIKQLQIPGGRVPAAHADTHVQFHQDQTHLLVVHESQIAIFEAPKLDCLKQVFLLIIIPTNLLTFLPMIELELHCLFFLTNIVGST